MFVKIGALSFLVLILFGSVMASPVCPWEPLKPSELGFTSITGQLLNGGTVDGVLFMGSSTLSGEVGNTTGYVSTSKDVLGKAQEITYAGTESLGYTSETAFIVSSGSLNFKESGMLSYSSTENPMYCEDAYTNVEVHLSDGQFASTMNVQSPVTLISHNSAVEGIGGLKVVAENGWFAARPSGTEDVYKIYAESFKGPEHLKQIQKEAQAMVDAAFKAAGV